MYIYIHIYICIHVCTQNAQTCASIRWWPDLGRTAGAEGALERQGPKRSEGEPKGTEMKQ